MATNTIKTRHQLCTKTTSEWGGASVLLKGELGIEKLTSGESKFKVGDGSTTYSSLKYSTMTPTEINNLINQVKSDKASHSDLTNLVKHSISFANSNNFSLWCSENPETKMVYYSVNVKNTAAIAVGTRVLWMPTPKQDTVMVALCKWADGRTEVSGFQINATGDKAGQAIAIQEIPVNSLIYCSGCYPV